jgi:hypothetical protein
MVAFLLFIICIFFSLAEWSLRGGGMRGLWGAVAGGGGGGRLGGGRGFGACARPMLGRFLGAVTDGE